MIGYFHSSVSHAEEILASSQKTCEDWLGEKIKNTGLVFSPSFSYMGPLDNSQQKISILHPLPEGSLKAAVIFPPLRYFCDAYGLALLVHVYNAIYRDGWMVIPFQQQKKSEEYNLWTLSWLQKHFGTPVKVLKNPKLVIFKRKETKALPISIYSNFVRECFGYAIDYFKDKSLASTDSYLSNCKPLLFQNETPVLDSCSTDVTLNYSENLQDLDKFFSHMNYSVTGVSYKTAALRYFINHYLSKKDKIFAFDIGGGAGFVDVELLLSCNKVTELVNCEPMSSNLPLLKRLYFNLKPYIGERYKVCVCSIQDYLFKKSFDLIFAFASLFYVPRSQFQETLNKIWQALKPDGILVIQENIKRPCFQTKNYYTTMFTVEELEGYLNSFGKIDYYRSSDLQPMDSSQVKDLTVFRVIQKRAIK